MWQRSGSLAKARVATRRPRKCWWSGGISGFYSAARRGAIQQEIGAWCGHEATRYQSAWCRRDVGECGEIWWQILAGRWRRIKTQMIGRHFRQKYQSECGGEIVKQSHTANATAPPRRRILTPSVAGDDNDDGEYKQFGSELTAYSKTTTMCMTNEGGRWR